LTSDIKYAPQSEFGGDVIEFVYDPILKSKTTFEYRPDGTAYKTYIRKNVDERKN